MNGMPIKFRGKRLSNGSYSYAEIYIDTEGVYITNDAGGGHAWKVEPDSIQQLCGYDGDGHEVYEGDKLSDQHGTIYTAALKGFAVADDDIVPLDPDDKNIPRLLLTPKE